MIDTVTLAFKESQYTITDYRHFVGKNTKQMNKRFCLTSTFTDMATQFKKQGKYFPKIEIPKRVTGKDRDETSYLLVQVSIPKLLYGTSLFEVDENDLTPFAQKLSKELERAFVFVTPETIMKATVKRIDLCKSITLPVYLGDARQVIHHLQQFNHKPNASFDYKEYRETINEFFIKYHNTTQGYVVYDKASEIVANGFTDIETSIIKHLKETMTTHRILRFELSLQRQQSLEALLRRHIPHKKKEFALEDLFSHKGAIRDILLGAFDRIYSPSHILLVTLAEMKDNELEYKLERMENLSLSQKTTLYYFANKTAKYGLKATLTEMKEKMTPSTYNRYKKELREIMTSMDTLGLEQPNLIQFLRSEHGQFKPLTPNRTANTIVNHCKTRYNHTSITAI